MKVLVVDDSPAILESMQTLLSHLGLEDEEIFTAENAGEAMKIFHKKDPDLVFMDVSLPHGGGDKVALQMLLIRPTARIVVMTGLDRTDPRVRAMVSGGAYDVIEKPVRVERVEQLLQLIDAESKRLRRVR